MSYTNSNNEIFCGDNCSQISEMLSLSFSLYNHLDKTCKTTPSSAVYYYYTENFTAADCMTIGKAFNLILYNTQGTCYEACHKPSVSFQLNDSHNVAIEYYCDASCETIKTFANTFLASSDKITQIFNRSGVCEEHCPAGVIVNLSSILPACSDNLCSSSCERLEDEYNVTLYDNVGICILPSAYDSLSYPAFH